MSKLSYAFALLAATGVWNALAAVEWQLVGLTCGRGVDEFRRVLERQTDAKPVKSASAVTYVFHVGEDEFTRGLGLDLETLHPYGYYIAIRRRQIALVGRTSEGSAYACFDFLKRYTGYRSFGGRFGEIVPKIGRFDLPEELTVREEPDVISYNLAGATGANGFFTRSGRLTCRATHAMNKMVKKEMYETHPEYFPLVNGKRLKPGSGPGNPCMSNPDLPNLFRAYAQEFFAENPNALGIPMGVNDGGGDCNCDGCLAIYRKHGNQYVEFYNTAAKILAEEHPGKYLAFIAYSVRCSQSPQDGLQMEPNILVEVTGYANTHAEWKAAGVRNFGTYEYLYALNASRMSPACYTHHIADYLRRIRREYGLDTFWEEYFCESPIFDAGRQYVVNELVWDMDADVEVLLDDYHRSMFGDAAEPMRRFSDVCEEAFVDNPVRKAYQDEYHRPIQFNGYTVKRIARADAALADAAKSVCAGTTERRRVDLVSKIWGAMRLLMDNWQVSKRLYEVDDPGKIVRLAERGLKDIADFRAYSILPADERDIFLDVKRMSFKRWKEQANSRFSPRVPLEKAIDSAFERIEKAKGNAAARLFFEHLLESPTLGVFAATRLYLMDNVPTNLVANGSFEDLRKENRNSKRDSDWMPFGQKGGWSYWKFPSSQAKVWTDSSEAHSGMQSVVIGENQLGCSVINCMRVMPNCRYRFSFWVKRNDDNGGNKLGSVDIRMKDGKGDWIDAGSAISHEVPPEAIGKWAHCSMIFTTPDRDDGVSIVPILSAPKQGPDSRLWFDDVRLEKLCEVPNPPSPQVAFAQATVRAWTAKWGAAQPDLKRDISVRPVGSFRAESGTDGRVVITGGDEGLRIGLYAWARACGVRWFSPAEEPIIPEMPSVVPRSFFRLHEPSFPYRGLHVCGCKDHYDPTVAHWMSFMGMNRRLDTLDEARRNTEKFRKYGLVSDTTVHSYSLIIPKGRYFHEHPEYFALLDGKRNADGGQLCLSNKGLREAFVRELKGWIDCVPNVSPVGICPNDGYGWCECESCRALDTKEDRHQGTVNGRVADFVRYVCSALPKTDVGHYSYSNFADFYKLLNPVPKNLKMSFTAFHCQAHPLCSESCEANAKFRKRIRDLKAWGVDFYVYDYYSYKWGGLPAPMWQCVSREFKCLKKEGASGFLCECGNAASADWSSFWPAFYTAATLLYDVDVDVDALVEDWCVARYGKASNEMLAYFREWEKSFDGSRCWMKNPDEFKWVFCPSAKCHLERARAADPANIAVLRAYGQYRMWEENLRLRESYPVVREITVTSELSRVPLYFVNRETQIPDLDNDVVTSAALKGDVLHLRLRAEESQMDALKVAESPYGGDNFEIFLADGRGNGVSYHFIVDSAANVVAAESRQTRWNWNWKHRATAVVGKDKRAWTLDFSLPLSDIHDKDGFSFTVVRNRYAGGNWQIVGVPEGGAFFNVDAYVRAKSAVDGSN